MDYFQGTLKFNKIPSIILIYSLLGAMFPLPRIIYAMASDGLLFQTMGKVHPKFQTPFLGTMMAGTLTGILACIFELSQLFTMMSIGTLLAYSMVAACVLILRYANTIKCLLSKKFLCDFVDMNKALMTRNRMKGKLSQQGMLSLSCTKYIKRPLQGFQPN